MNAPSYATGLLRGGMVFARRYEVVRCISVGGMGAVYEVLHRDTMRRRALKVMLPSLLFDEDMRRRFAREAVVTADVDSEHIVETFDAGVDEETGCPFLVMELLKGENLAARLRRRGSLDARETLALLEQAALALDKTHARSIVHRDLKPENLFVTARDDGTPRIKILDFGIAKVVAHSQAARGTRNLGSPLYMAPEQLDGGLRIGPATDLYAIGQIAFTLLVGRAYWEIGWSADRDANMYALLLEIGRGVVEPASARAGSLADRLPPGFDAWFARSTAREPEARFQRASEQVAELRKLVPGAGPVLRERPGGEVSQPVASAVTPSDSSVEHARAPGHTTASRPIELVARRTPTRKWPYALAAAAVAGGGVVFALRTGIETAPPLATSGQAAQPATPPAGETVPTSVEAPTIAPTVPPPSIDALVSASSSAAPIVSAPPAVKPPPRPAAPPPLPSTPAQPAATGAGQEPWRIR